MATILRYVRENGRVPFTEWLSSLKNPVLRAHVLTRLSQAADGNFGDFASVGQGVMELRIDKGPGYRVYYGLAGDALIVLLAGGDKGSQKRDAQKARRYWKEWKGRQV